MDRAKPKMSMRRINIGGRITVEITVEGREGAGLAEDMRALLSGLGYSNVDGNSMRVVCSSAPEIDAARNPLRGKVDV